MTIRRRDFISGSAAIGAMALWPSLRAKCDDAAPKSPPPNPKLAFSETKDGLAFDTGELRGVLRARGASSGLAPVMAAACGTDIAGKYGLFSHYRLLGTDARYGVAGWDWASQARLRADGSVNAIWSADEQHPFDMQADYRWSAPNALDVVTTVTARKRLRRFEVFLASYFAGFDESLVYVKGSGGTKEQDCFMAVERSRSEWQMFPRAGTAEIIRDGRWQRPPHPVDWAIGPELAAPLAMRRHAKTGLVGIVMAPAEECFAVSSPYGTESHGSIYFSLLGRDLEEGDIVRARSRLVVARDVSEDGVKAMYSAYLKGLHNE